MVEIVHHTLVPWHGDKKVGYKSWDRSRWILFWTPVWVSRLVTPNLLSWWWQIRVNEFFMWAVSGSRVLVSSLVWFKGDGRTVWNERMELPTKNYTSRPAVKWADSVRGSRTETTTPVQFSFVLLYIFFFTSVFSCKIECFWWNSSNKSERETQPKLQEADYPIGFLKENTMYVYMLYNILSHFFHLSFSWTSLSIYKFSGITSEADDLLPEITPVGSLNVVKNNCNDFTLTELLYTKMEMRRKHHGNTNYIFLE